MTSFSFSTRLRRLGAMGCAVLVLASPAAALQIQETNTVGPAELRGFSLPATRPQPQPEPEPTIAPVTPPLAQPRPQAPVATPAPAPAVTIAAPSAPPAPASTQPRPSASPPPVTREPVSVAPAEIATPAETQPGSLVTAEPTDALPAPESPTPAIVASPDQLEAPISPKSGFPWLYLLIGAAVAGLGFVGFRKLRTVGVDSTSERFTLPAAPPSRQPQPAPTAPQRAEVAPTPRPEPAPAASSPAPPPAGGGEVIGIVMRPWLELEFRPERATATSEGAGVQYEVTIRNTGNAPARNVRLAAQMFNAGPDLDREVSGFFARGIDERGAPPLTILPRTEMKLQSIVSMPRAEMREINVQGRSLFIPTVAFNLLYAWGRDKTGQTCSSHVVGREPEHASEKMAPFRLDLGPRTYRSVGQRPSALARTV